jgi:hypothetical protein
MKMRKRAFTIIIFLGMMLIHGQNKYQKGFYRTFDEILQNKPSADYNVELEKRGDGKIKLNGGNDFQLNALDNTIKRSNLKNDFEAYSDGENLYLNCAKLKLFFWYAKVVSDKKYFVFSAAFPQNFKDYGLKMDELSFMFGGIGGAFSGMELAMLRFPYILDKTNQKLTLVSSKNINEIFSNDKIILERYNNDEEKDKLEIILKYLSEWNEKH